MKCIIDRIEDMREQIRNNESYSVVGGLLKDDKRDSNRLVYAREAELNKFFIDEKTRTLRFKIEGV